MNASPNVMPAIAAGARAERTRRQLDFTRRQFGEAAADAHVPGSECPSCGAIPGFVHPAGCKSDRHPELGTEK
jgi:hypothetical protein